MRCLLLVPTALLIASTPLHAQSRAPADGGITSSLGQPRPWRWTAGAAAGLRAADDRGLGEGRLGLSYELINPMFSLAAIHGEVYARRLDQQGDAGARLRLVSPVARVGAGADYSARAGLDFVLSFLHPMRRGGVVGDGSVVRIDYLPTRAHTLTLGVEWPVLRRIPMGKTRPMRDHALVAHAPLPEVTRSSNDPQLDSVMRDVASSAEWIRRLTVPFLDHDGADNRAAEATVITELQQLSSFLSEAATSEAPGMSVDELVRGYHAKLARAFSRAAASAAAAPPDAAMTQMGERVAQYARHALLDEVLLPYNRLLGQAKKGDTLHGFSSRARGVFLRWLHVESDVPADRYEAVLWVFAQLLDIIEQNRADARAQWQDSRFVWLPLQYALLPEQHDTQAELDALIERAVGESFMDGNFVTYVINEQFQYHLNRTIRSAEDYHVLWTHDVRGFDDSGEPDAVSYNHVLKSYLNAMTERARAYDRTGKFPVYIILLDEWFYQINKGRLWLNLLEDPLNYRLKLPRGYGEWEAAIAAAQAELRAAVAASSLLQAQRGQFGDAWLRHLIRVQVNITNPADPSFWSQNVLKLVPLPDNMMRDHRKIVFYDIGEEDPYRGEAMYTGAGVGEHYASLSWEDRSLLVRGPAVLSLKYAARDLLLSQGVAAHDIPYPLQPRPRARDYDARIHTEMQGNQQPIRALEVHNGTGYAAKEVNIAKAVLYTLMPPGSVMKIPDSLWSSAFWGSALFGCSLRGVRVLVIAPSAANAPVPFVSALSRSKELLWRLVTAQELLAPHIAAAGGMLRVGVYDSELQVHDVPAKVRTLITQFGDHQWLRDLFGFPPQVYTDIGNLALELERVLPQSITQEFEFEERPKIHFKANFFASRDAWTLMTRREWGQVASEFAFKRLAQVQTRHAAVSTFEEPDEAYISVGVAMVEDWLESLAPDQRERVVLYTVIGSHNQNYRSMIIDGEVAFVMSGWPSIIPYLDLISLIGQCRWIERTSELETLLPSPSERGRRLSRWAKLVM